MEIAKLPPLALGLAGGLIVLAIASQWVPGARFAMRASIFFGIMAGFGWLQGWPDSLVGPATESANPVLGLAWLADVGLAGLFLVMGVVLTLGRGRGGAVSLVIGLLILTAGTGAKLGWWADLPPWSAAPHPALSAPGIQLLGAGTLILLASIGCLVAQRSAAGPAPYPEPPRQMPHIVLGSGHPDDEEENWDEDDAPEPTLPGRTPPATAMDSQTPLLDHPWTPLRKRAIRRHRHRRATRHGH